MNAEAGIQERLSLIAASGPGGGHVAINISNATMYAQLVENGLVEEIPSGLPHWRVFRTICAQPPVPAACVVMNPTPLN